MSLFSTPRGSPHVSPGNSVRGNKYKDKEKSPAAEADLKSPDSKVSRNENAENLLSPLSKISRVSSNSNIILSPDDLPEDQIAKAKSIGKSRYLKEVAVASVLVKQNSESEDAHLGTLHLVDQILEIKTTSELKSLLMARSETPTKVEESVSVEPEIIEKQSGEPVRNENSLTKPKLKIKTYSYDPNTMIRSKSSYAFDDFNYGGVGIGNPATRKDAPNVQEAPSYLTRANTIAPKSDLRLESSDILQRSRTVTKKEDTIQRSNSNRTSNSTCIVS